MTTTIEPTWHKGMYGCRQDMYGASVVLPEIARLTAELAAANAVLGEVRSAATRERMIEMAADALSEVTYTCSRTWEAWQYDTMTEDDFAPAWEDDGLLASVVDSVLYALDGNKTAPVVDRDKTVNEVTK